MHAKNLMTITAARNGFTLRTRSGIYIYTNIDDLVKNVESYAKVMLIEANNNAEPA